MSSFDQRVKLLGMAHRIDLQLLVDQLVSYGNISSMFFTTEFTASNVMSDT